MEAREQLTLAAFLVAITRLRVTISRSLTMIMEVASFAHADMSAVV
jgi:hypothetical protein